MDIISVIIYLVLAIVPVTILIFKKRYAYWRERGIPYDEPKFFYGSSPTFFSDKSLTDKLGNIYEQFKNKDQLVGLFLLIRPTILTTNLDLVKNILIKDFSNFTDRGVYYNEKDDPLSAHLFALDGHKWSSLRKKLSPTFTSGKMKFMFPTIVEVGERFANVFTSYVEKEGCDIAIKELLARFTTDVIGTCAFGIDCNSLKDPNAEFRLMGRRIFGEPRHGRIGRVFLTNFPNLARKVGVKNVRDDVSEFFMKAVKDTVAYREKNNIQRNDFMDILIQLKNEKTLESDDNGNKNTRGKLTIEEVAAQAFVFFIAGFETSSTTMLFCLYELCKNQEVQNKMRNEIENVLKKHDGNLTYEAMNEMHYMEQVISETLRKYPVVPILFRKPINDYKVPDTNYVIPKSTFITIPVKAIHYDKNIYPNPDKFDPERFTAEAIQNRHPQSWLPFGDGPRNCIGLRFGKMQAKIGLIFLLKNFKYSPCEKTIGKMEFDSQSFVLAPKNEIFVKVEKI